MWHCKGAVPRCNARWGICELGLPRRIDGAEHRARMVFRACMVYLSATKPDTCIHEECRRDDRNAQPRHDQNSAKCVAKTGVITSRVPAPFEKPIDEEVDTTKRQPDTKYETDDAAPSQHLRMAASAASVAALAVYRGQSISHFATVVVTFLVTL